ncbi:hypothetical protein QEG73_13260 [Chitinophagaceae bacterium 26-R-25]|nr:hypothetical protein [Chitinophagaceae bacterium 26-R-25]
MLLVIPTKEGSESCTSSNVAQDADPSFVGMTSCLSLLIICTMQIEWVLSGNQNLNS